MFAPLGTDAWTLRRVRLLVSVAFGLCAFAAPLTVHLYLTVGELSVTVLAFLVGAVTMAANPFILRWTGSLRWTSYLLCSEMLLIFTIQALENGGIDSASLIWSTTVPLVAMVLLGPRASGIFAFVVALKTLAFYYASASGVTMHRMLTEAQMRWWDAAGLATVSLFVALVAGMGESARLSSEARAESALHELRKANDELVIARDRAETAARVKAEFVANMSHEIRTPLNAVIGMSELLSQSGLSERQQEMATTVLKSGDALLALINDVLDLSKIDAGHLELEDVPFDLHQCVEDVVLRASPSLSEKRLEMTYDVEPGVPDAIIGDATRLGQILTNLLTNAVKFTHTGEVSVVVSATPAPRDEVRLTFRVRDTGIGIPPERLASLFDAFTQVDASTTRLYGGTGLGLAIVKRLVDEIGGDVLVVSEEGVGSTFEVNFLARPAERVSVAFFDDDLNGKRVLIVDDIETNRRLLAHQTACWGMVPVLAGGTDEALARLDAGETFDLAIVDAKMPGRDGLQLVTEMKRRREGTEIPIVMLTSISKLPTSSAPAGIFRHLTKPVRQAALFDTIVAALGSSRDEAAHAGSPPVSRQWSLRVLVAEDNRTNQRVTKAMLARLGWIADLAVEGEQAVAAADANTYDLILMDVQMPKVGGLDATREILSMGDDPPYIVAMTANAWQSDRERCLESGMRDYVAKPVRISTLQRVLERCARARVVAEDPDAAHAPAVAREPETTPRKDGPAVAASRPDWTTTLVS
ncbi:MAG: response regulator [Polyangiaceae bacterium]